MDLSIILPVYNVEPYLSSCLDSIFKKNIYSFEVIAINDGSTDNSLKILEDYKERFGNLIVINQQNSGPSIARNKGLESARGTFIYFFDSDDILMDGIDLISLANSQGADIVTFNAEVFEDNIDNVFKDIKSYKEPQVIYNSNQPTVINNIQLVSYSGAEYFNIIRKIGFYTPVVWRKIYRKKFLEKHNLKFYPNIMPGEDDLHFFQTLLCNPKIVHCNQSVLLHRIRSTSIMGSLNTKRRYESFNTVLLELLEIRKKYKKNSNELKNIEWAINVFFRKIYAQNPSRREVYRLIKIVRLNHIKLDWKTILKMFFSIITGK
ncbi:glycosyltransferase [Priestia aryabhattai]|uniref:glycosyltransferase n=1 Tax=Priestia aryabhattai TaxID=412384 RepID=UPI003D2D81F3